jgi:hypothetical protein
MDAALIKTLMEYIQAMPQDAMFIFSIPGNTEVRERRKAQWTQILETVKDEGYYQGKGINDVFVRTSMVGTLTL